METEQALSEEVREQEEVWAAEKVEAGWAAIVPEPGQAEIVSVQAAEQRFPIGRELLVILLIVLNAGRK